MDLSFELPQGRVRPVLTAPAKLLSEPCPEVSPTDPATIGLAADLVATMLVSPGCVGLAANQIGERARVFCLDVTEHPKTKTQHGRFVLINPSIVTATRKTQSREGCMSVPDFTGDVRRASRLVVTGYLPGEHEPITITTDAFEARAIQHEVDHLDGLLFLDRTSGAHALHPRKTYL
ncbi:MAG: peptide deformylase [Actinomycetia bacterium]|nr:peptide deformylase [Actinomycetes bacterium]